MKELIKTIKTYMGVLVGWKEDYRYAPNPQFKITNKRTSFKLLI